MPTIFYTAYEFQLPDTHSSNLEYEKIKTMHEDDFTQYLKDIKKSLWRRYWFNNSRYFYISVVLVLASSLVGWIFQKYEFMVYVIILPFGAGWMGIFSSFKTLGSIWSIVSKTMEYYIACRKCSRQGVSHADFYETQQREIHLFDQ